MNGTDYININAMDEAIAAYKQEQREKAEKLMLEAFKKVVEIHKQYNPEGVYLSCAYVEGTLAISNSYYAEDKEHPVHACLDEEGFDSFPLIDYSDDEEDD